MWKDDHFKLFISHVTSHGAKAHAIKTALETYHVSCFVAHDDIEPTLHWQDEIEKSLLTMDALAALLTPEFHQSKWTDQEVGYAMGSGRLVLPLRYGADPHGFIAKYQGYTIKEGVPDARIAKEIISILSRHPSTSRRMSEALVGRLESSWSWDMAKTTMDLLEECPVIPEELLSRIETAANDNCQVKEAWGVPSRIKSLVTKHRQIGE